MTTKMESDSMAPRHSRVLDWILVLCVLPTSVVLGVYMAMFMPHVIRFLFLGGLLGGMLGGLIIGVFLQFSRRVPLWMQFALLGITVLIGATLYLLYFSRDNSVFAVIMFAPGIINSLLVFVFTRLVCLPLNMSPIRWWLFFVLLVIAIVVLVASTFVLFFIGAALVV
jgi:hypothetical protein